MNKLLILVVEDDTSVRNLITTTLKAHEYRYLTAPNGQSAILEASSHNPDIVLLDLGLPDMDGMDVIKHIRQDSSVPIIVLSARADERDKVMALDLGANDYVTKPFGTEELLARVRAALRNTYCYINGKTGLRENFRLMDMEINYDKRIVYLNGKDTYLTRTEYNIVAFLSEHAGKVLTYASIIKAVWGYPDAASTKKLQVNMANIRKKLGMKPGDNSYIINELGVGYRMREQNEKE